MKALATILLAALTILPSYGNGGVSRFVHGNLVFGLGRVVSDYPGFMRLTNDDTWVPFVEAGMSGQIRASSESLYLIERDFPTVHIRTTYDLGETWVDTGSFPIEGDDNTRVVISASPVSGTLFAGVGRNMRLGWVPTIGLWKSTDGGATWRMVDGISAQGVAGMNFSPDFAEDGTAAYSWIYAQFDTRAEMTEDYGESWREIQLCTNDGTLCDETRKNAGYYFAFSPDYTEDGTIFAYGDYVWISTDRGGSWKKILDAELFLSIGGISISPYYTRDHTVVVGGEAPFEEWPDGFSGDRQRILLSQDSGNTWRMIERVGPYIGATIRPVIPLLSPEAPSSLELPHKVYFPVIGAGHTEPYAIEIWAQSEDNYMLVRSRDLGATWQEMR